MAAPLLGRLAERGDTLATAESLTGGLIGGALTGVPGASAVYLGGVISYATRLKAELGGVPEDLLAADGPVAASTALAMARGIIGVCGADWGLAVTGVAGPESQDGHPVGQVFAAVAYRDGTGYDTVAELALSGTRAEIRAETVRQALHLLASAVAEASSE